MILTIPYVMDLDTSANVVANGVPVAVPDAVFDPAAYNPATAYAEGARVHSLSTNKLYLSLKPANTGNALPVAPKYATDWWEEVGSINRFACGDDVLGNQTQGASPLVITIPTINADRVAALNVSATGVLFELLVSGTPVWSSTAVMIDNSHVIDAYSYDFGPVRYRTDALAPTVPPYFAAQLRVTLTRAGGGTVGIGRLVVGRGVWVGDDELGLEPGLVSYNTANLSTASGITRLSTDAGASKRLTTTTVASRGALDALMQAAGDSRDKYCLWSIDPAVNALNVFARHTRFRPRVVTTAQVVTQIELEGAV